MTYSPIAYIMPQYEDYPNYWMKAYEQGTTTALPMATDITGVTTAAKFEINASGFPVTAGAALVIPYISEAYDLWLFPTEALADANDTTNAIQIADNMIATSSTGSSTTARELTVATMIANTSISEGDWIETQGYNASGDGGHASYLIKTIAQAANDGDVITGNGNHAITGGLYVAILQLESSTLPQSFGYLLDTTTMTSIAAVDANWAIMKEYITQMSASKLMLNFDKILTMPEIYAHWISGTTKPLGFYSDSTTDGFKTTDHISSVSSDSSPFSVTITLSPNAYPTVLIGLVDSFGPAKTTVDIYNGGFDSESFASGFGLQHWYNVWFRAAGSNMSWTDVAAIVIGFGTSDSANLDDTATVISEYSLDLECVIIDCFLRGVQPILQTPVATVQHFGNTGGDLRNGDQTITIINAVQDRLAKKYDLEHLTYGASQMEALDGFRELSYGDIFSAVATDQVHPVDLGHRIQAGYLYSKLNAQVTRVSTKPVNLFAGSPVYKIEDESTNITDDVLTKAITEYGADVERLGEYFYKFPSGTAADTVLIRTAVYVERPSLLLYMPIDSTVIQPSFLIASNTHDDNDTITSQAAFDQPISKTYTKLMSISLLRHGLNNIYIKSNASGGEQMVGGLMVVPLDLIPGFSFHRETDGSTLKIMRSFDRPNNATVSHITQDINSLEPAWMRYNPQDNTYASINFTLAKTFVTATDYEVYAYFNDSGSKGDCYNIFRFNTDTLTVHRVVGISTVQVATVTAAGVLAAMVAGAYVEIKIRTRFYSSSDTNIQLHVDGVAIATTTVTLGDMWTQGYGLEMTNIESRSISITSIETQKGSNTNVT